MNREIDYDLAGKVALITGVSRRIGIGAALAMAFARAGAHVFTTYYRPADAPGSPPGDAEDILDSLRAFGVRAAGVEADLSDPAIPKALLDQAEAAIGSVDILINNATHCVRGDIYALTAQLLDDHYAVNVRGAALLCAEFARRHDGRPGGRIISLTSGQGVGAMPEELPYAITKGAVEALTSSMSASLIEKGITVNAVDPGGTETGWMTEELQAAIRAKTLGGRVGMPDDAARLILFLASSQGGWITGQILRSRGGL